MKKIILLMPFIFVAFIFLFTIRGLPGNPAIETLNTDQWRKDGPLELSPERGRYALLYSFMEDGSLQFSLPVAQFSIPDLAISKAGAYVSLFSPGVSFIAIPGYFLGKIFGHAQVGAFCIITLFALSNFLLVYAISIELNARKWAAFLAALTFSVATPAFAYSNNFYQHHISVFLLLSAIFVLLRYENYISLSFIWFAATASVVIDNPNIFLMLPVIVAAIIKMRDMILKSFKKSDLNIALAKSAFTFTAVLGPILFFGWYNFAAYGTYFQLPGTLPSVPAIGQDGSPLFNANEKQKESNDYADGNNEKTAIGFFKTRNLYNGFYEHFISLDRGALFFTPVALLGFLGFLILYRKRAKIISLVISTIGMNVLLYSMWGDPYGGWAFGSRYLIPTYALLSLGIALFLSNFKKQWALPVFAVLFCYSAWVNTLGALTTSSNPPKVQVLFLEQQTGHEQKYTYMRNWEFLHEKYSAVGSKSFVYQTFGKKYLEASQYFYSVYLFVIFTAILGSFVLYRYCDYKISLKV